MHWHLAAEKGHARAQYNLGVAYAHGRGCPQDLDNAILWWKRAAAQGHAEAAKHLPAVVQQRSSERKQDWIVGACIWGFLALVALVIYGASRLIPDFGTWLFVGVIAFFVIAAVVDLLRWSRRELWLILHNPREAKRAWSNRGHKSAVLIRIILVWAISLIAAAAISPWLEAFLDLKDGGWIFLPTLFVVWLVLRTAGTRFSE